mmetsp:Transcript_55051/g.117007  ORF Transcript_55051/g.117007 Transcript_55051/m.117007 type:complete len:337 (+) Transcript_55051:65-1075(+)
MMLYGMPAFLAYLKRDRTIDNGLVARTDISSLYELRAPHTAVDMSIRPGRWSASHGVKKPLSSPFVVAFLSTSTRTSSQQVGKPLVAIKSSCLLPVNGSAARGQHGTFKRLARDGNATSLAKRRAATTSHKRFHSSSPNNNNNRPRIENNTLATLSTLGNIFSAGTGTFASTLLALYLATVVETSAHNFLYEYFPRWYAGVREEDLPECLKSREVARRATGTVQLNRARGVEPGAVDGLMGMDGWMEQEDGMTDAELLLMGVELEDDSNVAKETTSMWERKTTARRANIIEEEERDFSRRFMPSEGAKTGLVETKKIQEEASRKFQEQLVGLAMTA